MQIHEKKMDEFLDMNKNKMLNEINILINKNIKEIESLKMEDSIKRVNNNYKDTFDTSMKINQLDIINRDLRKEYEYIKSNDKQMDYILSTHVLINEYVILDEKEKELMLNESEDVEKEMYELNYKKNNIIDQYMKIVDPSYVCNRITINMREINCKDCNLKYDIQDGLAVCYGCGICTSTFHKAEDLSYKEQQEMDYRPQFTYEKSTHLEDWLRRFQSKEQKDIPQEILDKVILEAHKHNITDLNTLTELQVKKYLKSLDLNDYYDNVISIINRINKRPPFLLTPHIDMKIKDMFQQIQLPFEKYKDPNRKNMLSYSYLLNKFFLILDLPEFSNYFFLLKSPEKLRQQDHTFKKIVDELAQTDKKTNWRFFPSL